jgi:hypothetical protein
VVACRQTLQFDTRLVAAGAFGVAGLHFLSAFKKSALFLSGKNPNAFRENKRRTTKRGGNSENFQIEQQAKKGQCAATLRPSFFLTNMNVMSRSLSRGRLGFGL